MKLTLSTFVAGLLTTAASVDALVLNFNSPVGATPTPSPASLSTPTVVPILVVKNPNFEANFIAAHPRALVRSGFAEDEEGNAIAGSTIHRRYLEDLEDGLMKRDEMPVRRASPIELASAVQASLDKRAATTTISKKATITTKKTSTTKKTTTTTTITTKTPTTTAKTTSKATTSSAKTTAKTTTKATTSSAKTTAKTTTKATTSSAKTTAKTTTKATTSSAKTTAKTTTKATTSSAKTTAKTTTKATTSSAKTTAKTTTKATTSSAKTTAKTTTKATTSSAKTTAKTTTKATTSAKPTTTTTSKKTTTTSKETTATSKTPKPTTTSSNASSTSSKATATTTTTSTVKSSSSMVKFCSPVPSLSSFMLSSSAVSSFVSISIVYSSQISSVRASSSTTSSAASSSAVTYPVVGVSGVSTNNTQTADVVIYGGTSSGVISAVEVARTGGKSVILIEPYSHLGGMTASGLGWVDTGNSSTIGGVALEFFTRVGKCYGKKGPQYAIEPHVTSQVFQDMITEATNVTTLYNNKLIQVSRESARITSLKLENGQTIYGGIFIDASYEGDLMAMASVSYVVGRESKSEFNEFTAGATELMSIGQGIIVDPWQVPGDPSSGILPNVQNNIAPVPGSGDSKIMSYNYRLCVTQNPNNRINLTQPAGYDPAQFEWLGRYTKAMLANGSQVNTDTYLKLSGLPNGKYDLNNQGQFSTDMVGCSFNYPDGSWTKRAQLKSAHKNYLLGLFWYLRTNETIPQPVRNRVVQIGLCADEFEDNEGWPYEIYIREGRRMRGDYVMTENNVRGYETVNDTIALGSYALDAHFLQRLPTQITLPSGKRVWTTATEGGSNSWENKIPHPYPISYRSLVPRAEEVNNLLVTVCMSSTHSAYRSIRMEPVYMMMGHAAGAAAVVAIDGGVTVQKVDYELVRTRLVLEGAILK
ncbi:hypothetical protein YB2330_003572 [Saitoella coloradoensis]